MDVRTTIQPVTDLAQRVIDTRVLATLAAAKIDPAFVEFHDYDGTRPYAKLYVDRKSDQRIQVVSGLPMARMTDGSLLTPGFERGLGSYWFRNNLFEGQITDKGAIRIAAVNDQPDGRLAGKDILWTPVLYVGKEVVTPGPVRLLETDPVNENYHENVIEWDYGKFCTRRIRVIEGRFRGSWIFKGDPGADVLIDYGAAGQTLRLGRARDERGDTVDIEVRDKTVEFIPRAVAAKGVTVGDSATFYPDAHTESATVDGETQRMNGEEDWSSLRNGAGTGSSDTGSVGGPYLISSSENLWYQLKRSIMLFNTATLDDTATISAAVLSLWGTGPGPDGKGTDGLGVSFGVGTYSSNPASNTAIVNADFTTLGTTLLSNTKYYNAWGSTAYNDLTLNSTGRGAISKTGVTKLGIREYNYDATGASLPWYNTGISDMTHYFAEYGSERKPKLVVTYSLATAIPIFINHYRQMRA